MKSQFCVLPLLRKASPDGAGFLVPAAAPVLCLALPIALSNPSWAAEVTCINVTAQKAPGLHRAAEAAGLQWRELASTPQSLSGELVVWEARGGGATAITPEQAAALGQYVQGGGNLLLTLAREPGLTPFRLAFMLPTTAWQTAGPGSVSAARNSGPVAAQEVDKEFYPAGAPSLELPFRYPLSPFHAVERGQGRYEKFSRPIPHIGLMVEANHNFWTRPLLNRDWRIRMRANDVEQNPLLLTGRYGAGKVAVFASSAEELPHTPESEVMWRPVLRWLTAEPTPGETGAPRATANTPVTISVASRQAERCAEITLTNPLATVLRVQLVTRLCTWENALLGDSTQTLEIPANGRKVARVNLPAPGVTSYQSLDYRDAYMAHVGVLTSDGGQLLAQATVPLDMRPAVNVQVETADLRSEPYPFQAPGPGIVNFPRRMGTRLNGYAYPPGSAVTAKVRLANGLINLAPLAAVKDETQPTNPSTHALNDEAAHAEIGPNTDRIQAYGLWTGLARQENVLRFSLPKASTLRSVTLVGSPDNYRNYLIHNPGAATVEVDGQEVARMTNLDQQFVLNVGRVRIPFAPRVGREVRVRLPWVEGKIHVPEVQRLREAPWLAEVSLEGWNGEVLQASRGTMQLSLREGLGGKTVPLGQRDVVVEPNTELEESFNVTLPGQGAGAAFYQLEATFAGQSAKIPLMAIQPDRPLASITTLRPPTAVDLGFIVTRGFRNVFEVGTGTGEIPPASWGTPDDLIWAFNHQLKQLGTASRTQGSRLYVTENDLRHYSTPWRDFPNGEYFYDVAPPLLVARLKKDRRWATADTVILSHSDRWDTAPDVDALHGWQDFIGFHDYLKAAGGKGLTGRTRAQITTEIHEKYEPQWQKYHLERYVKAVRNLRAAFAAEGKKLIITAQGSPLVPPQFESELTQVIQGQSDDSTWGMQEENTVLTDARQMGVLAYNPGWAMSTLIQWGWDSGTLNNHQWHNPVGTTEPSRRHIYNRAWRGTLGWDGRYRSIHTYGYNQNGGVSFTMNRNDWQEWWNVQERHSLIAPEAPLGAGLIISTARFSAGDTISWSGSGGSGKSEADDQIRKVQRAVRALQDAGLSLPFAANAGTLEKWAQAPKPQLAPLILLDLCHFSAQEMAAVEQLRRLGVPLVAFKGPDALPAKAAALFGVKPDGSVGSGRAVAQWGGKPVVQGQGTLLIATGGEYMEVDQARRLASVLQTVLQTPFTFPSGTSGYGFESQGRKFIVLEDWREEGRTVQMRIRADARATALKAVNANDGQPLTVSRQGAQWVVDIPVAPGDGLLIALDEVVPA